MEVSKKLKATTWRQEVEAETMEEHLLSASSQGLLTFRFGMTEDYLPGVTAPTEG